MTTKSRCLIACFATVCFLGSSTVFGAGATVGAAGTSGTSGTVGTGIGAGGAAGAGAAGMTAGTIGAIAAGVAVAAGIAAGVAASQSGSTGTSNSAPIPFCAVTVDKGVTTVAALSGTVTYTDSSGKVTKIDIGTGLIIQADGTQSTQTLASLIAAEQANGTASGANSLTTKLNAVMSSLATAVGSGQYSAGATTFAAAVLKVIATANPNANTAYTTEVVAAIANSKTMTADQKQAAVTAVGEASLGAAATVSTDAAANQASAFQAIVANNAPAMGLSVADVSAFVASVQNSTAVTAVTPLTGGLGITAINPAITVAASPSS